MARFINQQVIALSSICSGSAESEQAGCGDNQARPTVIDSRSILAGVQGFESLSPHSKQSFSWGGFAFYLKKCSEFRG